jgi:predicted enzyme related to lactoylglutathione lyase
MINGIHALMYAGDADATRAFFRDVLRLPAVDAGHGWLIFGLPPAELGIHPTTDLPRHELHLMCDDLDATMAELAARGATFTGPVEEAGYGRTTAIAVPGGGTLGLYEPHHPTALHLQPPAP